jgi:hypothetical protein
MLILFTENRKNGIERKSVLPFSFNPLRNILITIPENVHHQTQLHDHPSSNGHQKYSRPHCDFGIGHSGDLRQHLQELLPQLHGTF